MSLPRFIVTTAQHTSSSHGDAPSTAASGNSGSGHGSGHGSTPDEKKKRGSSRRGLRKSKTSPAQLFPFSSSGSSSGLKKSPSNGSVAALSHGSAGSGNPPDGGGSSGILGATDDGSNISHVSHAERWPTRFQDGGGGGVAPFLGGSPRTHSSKQRGCRGNRVRSSRVWDVKMLPSRNRWNRLKTRTRRIIVDILAAPRKGSAASLVSVSNRNNSGSIKDVEDMEIGGEAKATSMFPEEEEGKEYLLPLRGEEEDGGVDPYEESGPYGPDAHPGEMMMGLLSGDNLMGSGNGRGSVNVGSGLNSDEECHMDVTSEMLFEGEKVVVRILRPALKKEKARAILYLQENHDGGGGVGSSDYFSDDDEDHHDDMSVSTLGLHGADEEPETRLWIESYYVPLDSIKVLKLSKNSCDLQLVKGGDEEQRHVTFEHAHEAKSFSFLIQNLQCLQAEHAKRLFDGGLEKQKESHESKIEVFEKLEPIVDMPTPPVSPPESVAANRLDSTVDVSSTPVRSLASVEVEAVEPTAHVNAMDVTPTSTSRSIPLHQPDPPVELLIEIVSAVDLPRIDVKVVNPYCVVRMGDKEVHRTCHLEDTLDPIWTVATGSLFLLSTTRKQFMECAIGVCFEVRDSNPKGGDRSLGLVMVPQEELLDGFGSRAEFELDHAIGVETKGFLALRFRRATEEDIHFVNQMHSVQQSELLNTDGETGFVKEPSHSPMSNSDGSILSKRSVARIGENGLKQFRVKPGPDPKRSLFTEWMTKCEIEEESLNESRKWIEVGSGKLGKLHFEVIAFQGFADSGGHVGVDGKTSDAFASIVYEDCVVSTDVIHGVSCPRWMPWTQRAFTFHIGHPSSQIFFGIYRFNSDDSADHDPLGRIAIGMSNFHPLTTYTLQYNMYDSPLAAQRSSCGIATVRLRIEWNYERNVFFSAMGLPQKNRVNIEKRRDARIAQYTCTGEHEANTLNLRSMARDVEELRLYKENAVRSVRDAVVGVLLWRGHFKLSFIMPFCGQSSNKKRVSGGFLSQFKKRATVYLPLYSVATFCAAIVLVEIPNLFPSFLLGFIAWFCVAMQQRNPSPWMNCKSYLELFGSFVFNRSRAESIAPCELGVKPEQRVCASEENASVAEDDIKEDANDVAENGKNIDTLEPVLLPMQQWLGSVPIAEPKGKEEPGMDDVEREDAGKDDAEFVEINKDSNDFEAALLPLQQWLGSVCAIIRFASGVLAWEECYYSFWMTTVCILGAVAFAFVPWGLVMLWAARILAWTFLGPWMKLVDIFYVSKVARCSAGRERSREAAKAQLSREDAMKLEAMKQYLFGQYVISVPPFKADRYRDFPLPRSSAYPYHCEVSSLQRSDCEVISVASQKELCVDMTPKTRNLDGKEETRKELKEELGTEKYDSRGSKSGEPSEFFVDAIESVHLQPSDGNAQVSYGTV